MQEAAETLRYNRTMKELLPSERNGEDAVEVLCTFWCLHLEVTSILGPDILPCWAKPLGRSFVASSTTCSHCLTGTQARTYPHGLRTLEISISLSEKRFLQSLNFVRAFSATFRDFSAMNLQSNPGNRLIRNECNSGNLVQRDSRFPHPDAKILHLFILMCADTGCRLRNYSA